MNAKIRLIIGLGNEGDEYQKTYHNVGALIVAHLKKNHSEAYPARVLRFESELKGYMNVIGAPVARLVRKSGYRPEECLIVHDDSDQLRGAFKRTFGGSSGGHGGVQSVIEQLGTEAFWRLKIGIRDPHEKVRAKAEEFVLRPWSAPDEQMFLAIGELGFSDLLRQKLI